MSTADTMTCAEVLTHEVFSASQADSVQRAAEIMREANVGFLPICDDAGDVVGTLTDRDIVTRLVARGIPAEASIADIMTRGAATCSRREKVHTLLDRLRAERLTRLVCLDENGRLAGVVSLDDLARRQVLPHQVAAAEREIAVARTH